MECVGAQRALGRPLARADERRRHGSGALRAHDDPLQDASLSFLTVLQAAFRITTGSGRSASGLSTRNHEYVAPSPGLPRGSEIAGRWVGFRPRSLRATVAGNSHCAPTVPRQNPIGVPGRSRTCLSRLEFHHSPGLLQLLASTRHGPRQSPFHPYSLLHVLALRRPPGPRSQSSCSPTFRATSWDRRAVYPTEAARRQL